MALEFAALMAQVCLFLVLIVRSVLKFTNLSFGCFEQCPPFVFRSRTVITELIVIRCRAKESR